MAKLSTASVRLVQKMNRKTKSGEYPIYIVVCFNGRIEKATGVSCLKQYWDKRSESIKRQCPNAPVLNKMLNDIKNKVVERKNDYEYNNRAYTAQMLLRDDDKTDFNGNKNVFINLVNALVTERRLKENSRLKYVHTYNNLCEYIGRKDFLVDEVNLSLIKDFINWLTVSDTTIKVMMSNIASVWNYAISKRLVASADYPFADFKYSQKYKSNNRNYFLAESHMTRLKEYWLDMVIERSDNGMWHYKDGAEEQLSKRYSKEFGILWFLLCYKLNGSAPVEIAFLKTDNCKRLRINDNDYWAIDFTRQKTHSEVHVRWKRDLFCIIALEHFLGRSVNGFVYPIIQKEDSYYNMVRVSQRESEYARKYVREAFSDINEQIIKGNVENGTEEPIVNVEEVVMYTARHSFACHYLSSPNSSVNGLASLLSRSANTIATYVHQLTNDKDIADAVEGLPI